MQVERDLGVRHDVRNALKDSFIMAVRVKGSARVTPLRRAVVSLGLTQVIGWGSLLYAMSVLAPSMAQEFQLSSSWILGAFTGALVVSGLVARPVGRWLDRVDGRVVMSGGSALAAGALLLIAWSPNFAVFALGWLVVGLGMATVLYNAAFTSLGQISGDKLRPAITAVTLLGGFASTAFWPLTYALNEAFGWRVTMIFYAAANLLVCMPLHWTLPKREVNPVDGHELATFMAATPNVPTPPIRGIAAIAWLAVSFACGTIVFSALSVHLISTLQGSGLSGDEAVYVAMLVGPMQVLGRLAEYAGGSRLRATVVGGTSMAVMLLSLALLGLIQGPGWLALVFAALYGASNGVLTIVRGTVPAELFGRTRYGELLGKLAGPSFIGKACAPLAFAVIAEHVGIQGAVVVLAVIGLGALITYGIALACYDAKT
jgi:MFS family permease